MVEPKIFSKGELLGRIELVLTKEHDDLRDNLTFSLYREKEEISIEYPHSEILVDLFSIIQKDNELSKIFIDYLKDRIVNEWETVIPGAEDKYAGSIGLIFYTLIKLGETDGAIESLKISKSPVMTLVVFLEYLMGESQGYFGIDNLNEILKVISGKSLAPNFPSSSREEFQSQILKTRKSLLNQGYSLLGKELKGVNVEINQDKKEVLKKLGYLGFDEKYIKSLNEIDEFIHKENSGAVNAGMIGNLREFMAGLFVDIAKKISSGKGEEIPQYIGGSGEELEYMGRVRKYIQINLELSDKDNKFINGFIGILQAEGGHSFTSNTTYFRLSRNIAIEISLLILSKYEDIFTKKK